MRKCTKDIPALAKQVAKLLTHRDERVRQRPATLLKVLCDRSVLDDLVQAASKEQEGANHRPFDDAIRKLLKQK